MGKLLSLGARLRYPVTITKLLKRPGDSVKKQESVLEYSFKWMKEMGDHVSGDTWQEEQTTIASWDSPVEGVLRGWRLREGDAVHKDMTCMEVEEACSHEIQYHGMCAFCGEDMTEVNWASDQANTHRATVNMTHDQTGLMVSNELAARAEHDTQRRLLTQRKLSLVVDLDQTIIHACIEPTVGEWMADPSNPNYAAVKDVAKFQLNDEGPRGPVTSTCWYYIKMRPGLREFLEKVAEIYELHVYTMGTRAYALNIAKIVDPQKRLFGNRVISRDESGSMIAKDLQRLFPVSTNMVVIIDDRADVWPRNRPNLIKVVPYDFFKGIGDINSSFLPKRRDILPTPDATPPPAAPPTVTPDAKPTLAPKPSAIAELANNSADDKQLQEQAEEQERTLEQQIKDRPLLHAQEALDKENEEKGKDEVEENGHSSQPDIEPRANVLRDDDQELDFLQQHLSDLHEEFYKAYDAKRTARRDSPPKQAPSHDKPRRKSHDDGVDLSMVPDVGEVLDDLKARVLQDTVVVLSGLVPLGIDVTLSDIGLQAMSHGAQIQSKVSRKVTHLVVSTARTRTQKATQAAKIPSIKIVNQNWLLDSISQWKHLDEEPYLVHIEPRDRQNGSIGDVQENADQPTGLQIVTESSFGDDDDDSSMDDDDDEENGSPIDGNLDWDALNDEMNEFLNDGTDDDDDNSSQSDNDSVSRDSGVEDFTDDERASKSGSRSGVKRKADDADEDGSALVKRQRLARDRGASRLSSAKLPGDDAESSSLPTPQITDGDGDGGDGEGMDDLEAELEAALERELSAGN
ncbi:RNA polymerase II subunit A C-terminal domain phosphatase [Plectosphaerella plurivora]|uniref:RNA polymerase II subunit A C-terminal domain phosphatase n=1 Tax=Plectosphaerella plurivora TaxID=936078 RepID=A0A9P8V5W7_9PEZI|nr:RNA polymerase II subunit A C-terminal domain phosphatase [Plectosphaerella plurivora]